MVKNRMEIQCKPVLITLKYTCKEQKSSNLKKLKDILQKSCLEIDRFFQSSSLTPKETYILGKAIRTLNNAFRRHKFLQLAKRILKLVNWVDAANVYGSFCELSASLNVNFDDTARCFNAEYFDEFLTSLHAIVCRLSDLEQCCLECCKHMDYFLSTGHFLTQCCTVLGCIAVIRSAAIRLGTLVEKIFRDLVEKRCGDRLKSRDESYCRKVFALGCDVFPQESLSKQSPDLKDVTACMEIFQSLLKQYNTTMNFKLGLNKALVDQNVVQSSSIAAFQQDSPMKILDYGVVVNREDFSIVDKTDRHDDSPFDTKSNKKKKNVLNRQAIEAKVFSTKNARQAKDNDESKVASSTDALIETIRSKLRTLTKLKDLRRLHTEMKMLTIKFKQPGFPKRQKLLVKKFIKTVRADYTRLLKDRKTGEKKANMNAEIINARNRLLTMIDSSI